MKLNYKQIAVFGQVKVNIKPMGAKSTAYTTLLDLYKDGWWVTDRLGTIITIVKPKPMLKYGFHCLCRHVSTDINLDTLDALTKPYAEIKYLQYKNYLESKKPETKNEMPTLPPRNNNILRQTQGKTSGQVQGNVKKSGVYKKKTGNSTKVLP